MTWRWVPDVEEDVSEESLSGKGSWPHVAFSEPRRQRESYVCRRKRRRSASHAASAVPC